MVSPAQRRELAQFPEEEFQLSERGACDLAGPSRAVRRYRSRRRPDPKVRSELLRLAAERPRFGYRRLGLLLRRGGLVINHKRVWRIYPEEGLVVRGRRRKRLAAAPRETRPEFIGANQRWSMDFMSDALRDGGRIRQLKRHRRLVAAVPGRRRGLLAVGTARDPSPGARRRDVRIAEVDRDGQRTRIHEPEARRLGARARYLADLHPTREANGACVRGELQRPGAQGVPRSAPLRRPQPRPRYLRGMAVGLQHDPNAHISLGGRPPHELLDQHAGGHARPRAAHLSPTGACSTTNRVRPYSEPQPTIVS